MIEDIHEGNVKEWFIDVVEEARGDGLAGIPDADVDLSSIKKSALLKSEKTSNAHLDIK